MTCVQGAAATEGSLWMVMDGYGRFVSICLLRVGLYCSEDLGNCTYIYITSSDRLLSALVLTFCLLVNIPCRFKTLLDWVTRA